MNDEPTIASPFPALAARWIEHERHSRGASLTARRDLAPLLVGASPAYTLDMTPELADVIAAGKSLDADEREIAVLAIQHVDEDEQAAIDAAWDDEIDRRIEDIESGRVELIDSWESLRKIRAEFEGTRDE